MAAPRYQKRYYGVKGGILVAGWLQKDCAIYKTIGANGIIYTRHVACISK
jgi:hypothetical protein